MEPSNEHAKDTTGISRDQDQGKCSLAESITSESTEDVCKTPETTSVDLNAIDESTTEFLDGASLESLHSRRHHHLLDTFCRLHEYGLEANVPIPTILICGSQSYDTPSMINSITSLHPLSKIPVLALTPRSAFADTRMYVSESQLFQTWNAHSQVPGRCETSERRLPASVIFLP